MRANLSQVELQSLFRQTYLRDWDDLLPIIDRLPKDDAARILLIYIDPGMIREQEHPESIAGLFDCQVHPRPYLTAETRYGVPLSEKQFSRLRRVLRELKNLQTPAADSCLLSRQSVVKSAIDSLDQSFVKMRQENSANTPIPEDAIKAHDQLVTLLSDLQTQPSVH
jgi:hypothetical protein